MLSNICRRPTGVFCILLIIATGFSPAAAQPRNRRSLQNAELMAAPAKERSFGKLDGLIECVTSKTCPATNPFCLKGMLKLKGLCVECINDADCAQGESCSTGNSCASPRPAPTPAPIVTPAPGPAPTPAPIVTPAPGPAPGVSSDRLSFSMRLPGYNVDSFGAVEQNTLCNNILSLYTGTGGTCTITSVLQGSAIPAGNIKGQKTDLEALSNVLLSGSAATVSALASDLASSVEVESTLLEDGATPVTVNPVKEPAAAPGPSCNEITVTWTAPTAGGAGILFYNVICISSVDTVRASTANGFATSAVVGPITSGVPYSCSVTSVAGTGKTSTATAADVTTNCDLPTVDVTSTEFTSCQGDIAVSFDAVASAPGKPAVTGYEIQCTGDDSSQVTGSSSTAGTVTVQGANVPDTSYTCQVVAVSDVSKGVAGATAQTGALTATAFYGQGDCAPPAVTVDSAAFVDCQGTIDVTFAAPSPKPSAGPITGYTAECTGSDSRVLQTTSATAGTVTVSGASLNSQNLDLTYTCTVTAETAAQKGTPGTGVTTGAFNSAAFYTNGDCDPPTPTINSAAFTDCIGTITVDFSIGPQPGIAPSVLEYSVACTDGVDTLSGTANDIGTVTLYAGYGSTSTSYDCTVKSTNVFGSSADSASMATSTLANYYQDNTCTPPTIAVTGASLTSCQSEIQVVVTAPDTTGIPPVTDYTATCQGSDNNPYTANGAELPLVVLGNKDDPTLTYDCTVVATNAAGTSPISNVQQTTSLEATELYLNGNCVPPSVDVTVAEYSDCVGGIKIDWTAPDDSSVPSITSYNIKCEIPAARTALTVSGTATAPATTGTVSGASLPGNDYVCSVQAVNAAGVGPSGATKSTGLLAASTVYNDGTCDIAPVENLQNIFDTITCDGSFNLNWTLPVLNSKAPRPDGIQVTCDATDPVYSPLTDNLPTNAIIDTLKGPAFSPDAVYNCKVVTQATIGTGQDALTLQSIPVEAQYGVDEYKGCLPMPDMSDFTCSCVTEGSGTIAKAQGTITLSPDFANPDFTNTQATYEILNNANGTVVNLGLQTGTSYTINADVNTELGKVITLSIANLRNDYGLENTVYTQNAQCPGTCV